MKSFTGQALRWEWRDGVIELTLDRAPANEIGSLMLDELEDFVEFARQLASETSACVITSAERARDLRQRPAYIHAAAQGMGPNASIMTNYYKRDFLSTANAYVARDLWSRSDIQARDVRCAQLYDAFTPLILVSLEEFGFVEPGEAGRFALEGNLQWPNGRLPTNTSGGSLSEAYVHGFNLICEGVRQIRGTSTCQVPDCESVLVTSGAGVPNGALLLRG